MIFDALIALLTLKCFRHRHDDRGKPRRVKTFSMTITPGDYAFDEQGNPVLTKSGVRKVVKFLDQGRKATEARNGPDR